MNLGPEDRLAIMVWAYLEYALPRDAFAFHVPNEGKRGWKAQYMAKYAGIVSGVPDLVVIYQGKSHHIELKAGKEKPTQNQETVMGKLFNAGAPCAVAYSIEDVENALTSWKIPVMARVAA